MNRRIRKKPAARWLKVLAGILVFCSATVVLFVAAAAVLPLSTAPPEVVVINLVVSVVTALIVAWFAARKMSTLSAILVSGLIVIVVGAAVVGAAVVWFGAHPVKLSSVAPGLSEPARRLSERERQLLEEERQLQKENRPDPQSRGSPAGNELVDGGSAPSDSGGGAARGPGGGGSGSSGPGNGPAGSGAPQPSSILPPHPIPLSTSMPEFPWPPPQGSASYVLPDRLFASQHTVGDATAAIIDALEQCGYVERSFFQTPAGGVALVTRLERINDDGSPAAAGSRWPTFMKSPDANLFAFLRGLFFVDPGHYRVIAFILQGEPFTESPQLATRDETRSWLTSGANVVPVEIARRSFEGGHVTIIIYEFASDGTSVLLVPSPLTAKEHLEKAGVLSRLEKAN